MVQQNNTGGGGKPPINVNVDRASVARADVTRMSIDGNTRGDEERILSDIRNGIVGSDSLKNKLDSIHQAIQACCVAGGGAGGGPTAAQAAAAKKLGAAQSDAADAAGDAAAESGSLVGSIRQLQESIRVLISQQGSLSVSTGDAADSVEKAGGAALAGQKAQEAQYKALERVLFEFRKEGEKMVIRFGALDTEGKGLGGRFDSLMESLKEARMAEYVKTLNLATQALQNFQAELVDVQSQFRKFWDDAKGQYEEAANGLATTFSLLTDEFENIVDRFRGINRDTERMVIEAIRGTGEQQAALLMGQSLEEIGAFTRETRDAVQEDLRLQAMFGYKGANEAAVKTFKLLTRRGVQDDIARSQATAMARHRMTLMANIAQNTGLTLEAVEGLQEEASESVENLVATGALQGTQVEFVKNLLASAKAQGLNVDKMVLELASARGNVANLDENLRKQLIAFGGFAQAQEIMAKISQGQIGKEEEVIALLQSIGADQKESLTARGVAANKQLELMNSSQQDAGLMIRELQGLRDVSKTPDEVVADPIRGVVDDFAQEIAKYVPSFTGLGIAVAANTVAVAANTIALWRARKGIPGMGGPTSPKWTTSPGATVGKDVGKKGVGAAIKRTGGRVLGAGARGLGLLGAGGGLVAAGLGGWELGGLLNKAWSASSEALGGAGSLGSDIFDWFGPDESNITKSITIEDINKSRAERGLPPIVPKVPATKSAAPSAPASPMPPDVTKRLTDEEKMERMEKTLRRIADSIDQGNVYAKDMANGMGKITSSGGNPMAGDVSMVASGTTSK